MNHITIAVATFATLIGPGVGSAVAQAPAPRTLQLSFDATSGVTLVASQVTIREILSEWARQCGCYVVNADRLPGGPLPVPLRFDRVAQATVLGSLLRQAAGYVLTPRRPGSTGPSDFETIYILPTSSPSARVPLVTGYAPPAVVPIATVGAPDDEIPPVTPEAMPRSDTTPAQPASQSTTSGVSLPMTTVLPVVGTPQPRPAGNAPRP